MKFRYLYYLTLLLSFIGCSHSANHQRMLRFMEEVDSLNRNYISLSSDSVMSAVTSWMDSHGTPNERMKAHYLQAAVYRDRGQAPEALNELQTAVQFADTNSVDCDYHLLSRVHGQMAELFFWQNLPYEMLYELDLYGKYSHKDGDTLAVIEAYSKRAEAYELLGMNDSVIAVCEKSSEMYEESGDTIAAIKYLCAIVTRLIDKGDVKKATQIIKSYDELFYENTDFEDKSTDTNIYYYIKGKFFLANNKIDSAEYMFRQLLDIALNPNDKEGAYVGLTSVFEQKGKTDSVVKYLWLSYHICDSVYRDENINRMQQMHAVYNYDRFRLDAAKSSALAKESQSRFYVILLLLILFIGLFLNVFISFTRKRKKEIEQLRIRHQQSVLQMRQAQEDLIALHDQQYSNLIDEKNRSIQLLQKQLEDYSGLINHYNPSSLEERLSSSNVILRFRNKLNYPQKVELDENDWQELNDLINCEIPRFFGLMNKEKPLSLMEYRLCILIRLGFQPKEQMILLSLPPTYNITVYRKRLYKKIFGVDGSPKELDRIIHEIK